MDGAGSVFLTALDVSRNATAPRRQEDRHKSDTLGEEKAKLARVVSDKFDFKRKSDSQKEAHRRRGPPVEDPHQVVKNGNDDKAPPSC